MLRKATKEVRKVKTKYGERSKLKGLMREKGITYRSLSEIISVPLNSLNNKLQGHTLFDIIEVSKVCAALDIDSSEIPIFFCPDVTKCNTVSKKEYPSN